MKEKTWVEGKGSIVCPVLVLMAYMTVIFFSLNQARYLERKIVQANEEEAKRLIERIKKHFSKVTDPRATDNQKHKFIDIIVISLCATMSGAEGWTAFVRYGKSKEEFLGRLLELQNGISSADTLRRVVSGIDPLEWQECFMG